MRLFVLTCFMLFFICGCGKKENKIVDSIYTSGCLFTGEIIAFSPSLKNPSATIKKVEWSFGDGSANAHTREITHVYDRAGTYTVTLTINKESATKTINIAASLTSPHIAAMGGERQWKGTGGGYIIEFNGSNYVMDTAIDTKLTINVINNKSVQLFFPVMAPVFTLTAINETATTLTFTDCGNPGRDLTYNYSTNVITYSSYWTYGKRYGRLDLHTY